MTLNNNAKKIAHLFFLLFFIFFASFFVLRIDGASAAICETDVDLRRGLVPCGRILDNPATSWNETEPCNLCHVVIMSNDIINYLIKLAGTMALLGLVAGGFLYAIAGGSSAAMANAKNVIVKTIKGFFIVLLTWLFVSILMVIFGFYDPIGDGSWAKFDCGLNTTPTFCGDGIINGLEVCDGGMQTCETTFDSGTCTGIPVTGTQTCNACCSGWNECVAAPPVETGGTSSACASTSPALEDYACCELTSCTPDGCSCCGRDWGAATPLGYTTVQNMSPCGLANNSCKMNQSNTEPRNWILTTEHTTATYKCWE